MHRLDTFDRVASHDFRPPPGAVNTEVVIEIAPGVELTSVITKYSAESASV